MLTDQQRLRLACRIARSWRPDTSPATLAARELGTLTEITSRLERCRHRLALCGSHGLIRAACRVRRDADLWLSALTTQVGGTQRSLQRPAATQPTIRQLCDELRQIEDEFGDVDLRERGRILVITTAEITLDGTELGAFEIQIRLTNLAAATTGSAVAIVALSPNPPAGRGDVTHPHVSDERLCTGEAGTTLDLALQSGRLADAVQIITRLLKTYNNGSPYVALEDWGGALCHECDDRVDREDLYVCRTCNNEHCDNCSATCCGCDETFCDSCRTTCSLCDEPHCEACLTACARCNENACPDCIENGVCTDCHEETRDDDKETAAATAT